MNLRENILATLAYYDVLDLPLRVEEILARLVNFKHLDVASVTRMPLAVLAVPQVPPQGPQGASLLTDIKKGVDQLILNGLVNRVEDYYFLFDREYLVPLRFKHEKVAKYKWRKARRAIRWLRLVPCVEAVFASGSLAINNTDELSDLDVLVVVGHGRMWTARLLISAILSILRMRRRGLDKIAPNKICLNHYISDKSLKIPFKSIYNAQTYSNLVPVYLRNTILMPEFKKENAWVLDFVFNWNIPDKPSIKSGLLEMAIKLVETILNTKLGNALERWARHLQYQRIARNPLTKKPGGRVIFSDEQLEFHPHSIETSIIKKYNDNLVKLGMPELAIEQDSGLIK